MRSKLLSNIPHLEHDFQAEDQPAPEALYHCKQVHSDRVVALENATELEKSQSTEADGLWTSRRGSRIGVKTADCLPVLFASHDGFAVAAVHAGWRGLEQGILVKTVQQFESKGIEAGELVVAIGPAIGPCCFEVDQKTLDAFQRSWSQLWKTSEPPWIFEKRVPSGAPEGDAGVSRSGGNFLWLDLDRIAKLQLVSVGVPSSSIEDVGGCTYCASKNTIGRASYRRSCHEAGVAGGSAEAAKRGLANSGRKLAGQQWSWIGKV